MKCSDCKYLHHLMPSIDAPNGEVACMKTETDLWGVVAKDVANCQLYDPLPKAPDPTEST